MKLLIYQENSFLALHLSLKQSHRTKETLKILGERLTFEKKEETVNLSTTEFKYVSYFIKIKRQVESVWTYPKESQYRGEHGTLFLVFTIRRNGDLEGVQLLTSSGYARLDDEAVRALTKAAPYPPFPASWGGLEKLHIRATFEYSGRRIF